MDYSLTTVKPVVFNRYITLPVSEHDGMVILDHITNAIQSAGYLAFTCYISRAGHSIYVYNKHNVEVRILRKGKPIPEDIQAVINSGKQYIIRYG